MTKKCAVFMVSPLLASCVWGCLGPSLEESAEPDLVALGFRALMDNDVTLVQPLVMTEERYRQAREELRDSTCGDANGEPSDAEIKELALEATETLAHSFSFIRDLLDDLGFDFDKAQLTATVVHAPRNESDGDTRWIRYSSDDPRTRLDINYVIESEKNVAVVKLNDVLLVGRDRYLARGYRFQAYKPADPTDKAIMRLVIHHHLDVWWPLINEEP